ncbi:hypothetical protein MTO96_007241 [Rhipicephalus appendiculatus]
MQQFGVTLNKYSLNPEALPTLYLPNPEVPAPQQDGVLCESPAAVAVKANESMKERVSWAVSDGTATQATPGIRFCRWHGSALPRRWLRTQRFSARKAAT